MSLIELKIEFEIVCYMTAPMWGILQATISRLPDQGANIEKKIQETKMELEVAEYRNSKENFGVQQQSKPAAPPAIIDLSPPISGLRKEPEAWQKPRPLSSNIMKPSGPPAASTLKVQTQEVVRPKLSNPSNVLSVKPKPVNEMPSWSLLSDSPSSSRGSPAPTSRVDVDDMAEALSSLKLRLH